MITVWSHRNEKEVHFFDQDHRFARGPKFYAERYKHCDAPYAMDATPETMLYSDRVRQTYRAAGQLDSLRIIVVLREPVARELSLYNHLVGTLIRKGSKKKGLRINDQETASSFSEYIDRLVLPAITSRHQNQTNELDNSDIYHRRGLYSLHVKELFRRFERRHILLLSYAELKQQPDLCLERVRRFLCLPQNTVDRVRLGHANVQRISEKFPTCETQSKLAQAYQPFNDELYGLLDDHRGAEAEQYPCPRFDLGQCIS